MRNVRFNKKAMVIYLIFTFGLAYIIQICAASLYEKNRVIGQLVTAAMMFVPALGAVLSGAKLDQKKYQNLSDCLVWFDDPDCCRSCFVFPDLSEAL